MFFPLQDQYENEIVLFAFVLLGICVASDVGGVHDTDVELVFVAIVPVALPKK